MHITCHRRFISDQIECEDEADESFIAIICYFLQPFIFAYLSLVAVALIIVLMIPDGLIDSDSNIMG